MNWHFDPSVSVDANYSDNLDLEVNNPKNDSWIRVIPSFNLNTKDARDTLYWSAVYRVLRYKHIIEFDTEEVLSSVHASHNTVNTLWQLEGQYALTANRSSALEDTGRFVATDRQLVSVTPSAEFKWSQSVRVEAKLVATDVRYPDLDADDNRLIDYINVQTRGIISHEISNTSQIFYVITAAEFEAKANATEIGSTEYEIGLLRHLSATASLKLTAGVRRTEARQVLGEDYYIQHDQGFLGSIKFNQKNQKSSWLVSLNSNVVPTGLGTVQEQNRFQIVYDRQLAAQLRLDANVEVTRINTLSDASSARDRRYARLRAGLSWNLSKDSVIMGSYQFTTQKYEDTLVEADWAEQNYSSLRFDTRF